MANEYGNRNTAGSAALQLEHIYIRSRRETRDLVDRIAGNLHDALQREVAENAWKTGNLYRAINKYKTPQSPNFYRVGVGFRNSSSASRYALAQNYGDTTVAKMIIPWGDVEYNKIPKWVHKKTIAAQNERERLSHKRLNRKSRASRAEIMAQFPHGIPIQQRTLKPKGFIEEAERKTLKTVGIEAAKFMRAGLSK